MLDSIQKNVAWKVIPLAGIVGGVVLLLTNFVLSPIVYDVSGLILLRYFAGLVMGSDAVSETGSGVLVVGLLVHLVFSIIFALIIAVVVHRWGLPVGIVGGAILGLAIYGINLYTMTTFFEWFFAVHSTVLLIGHILYGATVGAIYESFDHYDMPINSKEERYETV